MGQWGNPRSAEDKSIYFVLPSATSRAKPGGRRHGDALGGAQQTRYKTMKLVLFGKGGGGC